jgi:hypothetical protein
LPSQSITKKSHYEFETQEKPQNRKVLAKQKRNAVA